jgi:hypothetical protein
MLGKSIREKAIARLDKTSVTGLAEAIAIAMSGLVDKDGRYVNVRLSEDMSEQFSMFEQLASMLLGVKND